MSTPVPVAENESHRPRYGIAALAIGLPAVGVAAVPFAGILAAPAALAALGFGIAALAMHERRPTAVAALIAGAVALPLALTVTVSAIGGLGPALRLPAEGFVGHGTTYTLRFWSTEQRVVVGTRTDTSGISVSLPERAPWTSSGTIRRDGDGRALLEVTGRPLGADAGTVSRCTILVDGRAAVSRTATGGAALDCRATG